MQEDWPNSNFCYYNVMFKTSNLDKMSYLLPKPCYNLGGQTIPGFPAESKHILMKS